MSTCTHATNSAANRMYCAAAPASTTTRYSAACTTFCERTTPIAAPAIATARIQNGDVSARPPAATSSPLTSAPISSGSGSGTVSIHSPSVCLSCSSLEMLHSEYSYSGLQNERVERAHLDADPAVHAERVVDVEAVEHAHRALAATLTARRALLLVALDVDAPVGALARAQHADGAVLLLERDDATGARRRVFRLVRVLHGDRGLEHRLEGDAETADQAGELRLLAIRTPP